MSDEVKIPQRIAQSYRELGAEEPPRALDEAILAASRRGRQRWYAPLATAAVLVLAVAVTLNMQRERPGVESPATQAPLLRGEQSAEKISSADAQQELKPKPKAEPQPAAKPAAPAVPASAPVPAAAPVLAAREPQPFAANQAAGSASGRADDSRRVESSVTGALARQMEERTSRDAEAASRAPRLGPFQAQKEDDTPERERERIAVLRAQGQDGEADRALAEFRKRYPDFRIPDAMRERVERRYPAALTPRSFARGLQEHGAGIQLAQLRAPGRLVLAADQ